MPTARVTSWLISLCVSTSVMGTWTVLVEGGFLDAKWHPTTVDSMSAATVTSSLTFTTSPFGVARSLIGLIQTEDRRRRGRPSRPAGWAGVWPRTDRCPGVHRDRGH